MTLESTPSPPEWLREKIIINAKKAYSDGPDSGRGYIEAVSDGYVELIDWALDFKHKDSGQSLKKNTEDWNSFQEKSKALEKGDECRSVSAETHSITNLLFSGQAATEMLKLCQLESDYTYNPK